MTQKAVQLPVSNQKTKESEPPNPAQVTLEELIESMKSLQDDFGQIFELSSEEKRIVEVFFDSFLKLMKPLAKTIPVSPASLTDEIGNVIQANVDPKGNLVLLYPNGQVEIRNLSEESERDLMICVLKDVMPKFKQLTNEYRRRIENRMNFLSSVTQEMQKISNSFSEGSEE